MFDIGWSELVVVAVVALIAIGPKELPGVLRMVGQWMGKARRMAFDFQGQLNEAMREAEMADIKKQFDDVSAAARDMSPTNLLTSLGKDASDAMKFDLPEAPSFDSPSSSSAPAESEVRIGLTELPPSEEAPSTFTEAEAHALMVEKPTDHPADAPAPQTPSAAPDVKAS